MPQIDRICRAVQQPKQRRGTNPAVLFVHFLCAQKQQRQKGCAIANLQNTVIHQVSSAPCGKKAECDIQKSKKAKCSGQNALIFRKHLAKRIVIRTACQSQGIIKQIGGKHAVVPNKLHFSRRKSAEHVRQKLPEKQHDKQGKYQKYRP